MHYRTSYLDAFKGLRSIHVPRPLCVLAWISGLTILFLVLFLVLTPWVQTASGDGVVTTFHPSDRPQIISAPVKGRIKKWHVHEGSVVKKDDILLEIVDNDPNYIERLELELQAVQQKLEVARIAAETSKLDYLRKQELFEKGLSSRRDLEKSKIEYNQYLEKQAAATSELAKVQAQRSRQDAQNVKAPGDGTIIQLRSGDAATFIKEGDFVASFIPSETVPAVELFIKGIDTPLVKPGAKVRLQFEGWPAVQFSGWPSISVGSFGGIVQSIDPSISVNGKFRVLVVRDPEEPWPNENFLRFGARARGWILLQTVRVGYEWWRQLNGFPPLPPENASQGYMSLKTYGSADDKNEK